MIENCRTPARPRIVRVRVVSQARQRGHLHDHRNRISPSGGGPLMRPGKNFTQREKHTHARPRITILHEPHQRRATLTTTAYVSLAKLIILILGDEMRTPLTPTRVPGHTNAGTAQLCGATSSLSALVE